MTIRISLSTKIPKSAHFRCFSFIFRNRSDLQFSKFRPETERRRTHRWYQLNKRTAKTFSFNFRTDHRLYFCVASTFGSIPLLKLSQEREHQFTKYPENTDFSYFLVRTQFRNFRPETERRRARRWYQLNKRTPKAFCFNFRIDHRLYFFVLVNRKKHHLDQSNPITIWTQLRENPLNSKTSKILFSSKTYLETFSPRSFRFLNVGAVLRTASLST